MPAPASTALGDSDPVCAQLSTAIPDPRALHSAADLDAAVAAARPIATAVIWSASLAQGVADPDEPTLAAELRARPTTDQVLRYALTWDGGERKGAPPLGDGARAIATAMLWRAINDRDAANTAWLMGVVDRGGWPTISAVGADAAHAAWLLIQHADARADLQLRALRLMEPLVARGEASGRDLAFLHDRVMLAVGGKQRYGTQATCIGGRRTPLPLEDEGGVDARRRSVGLGTLAENMARLDRLYGACPAS